VFEWPSKYVQHRECKVIKTLDFFITSGSFPGIKGIIHTWYVPTANFFCNFFVNIPYTSSSVYIGFHLLHTTRRQVRTAHKIQSGNVKEIEHLGEQFVDALALCDLG
jgi:hypothetical protein